MDKIQLLQLKNKKSIAVNAKMEGVPVEWSVISEEQIRKEAENRYPDWKTLKEDAERYISFVSCFLHIKNIANG